MNWKQWGGLTALVVTLVLVMMRLPVILDTTPEVSYHSLLYETLRLGNKWGAALVTTDGPLSALQNPVYAGGSIWMAVCWQIGGNALLASVLIGAAYQMPWPRRWWALGLYGAVLARLPTLAPWIAVVLLGWGLIRTRQSDSRLSFVFSGLLGFLALTALGHLLLGVLAVGLTVASSNQSRTRLAAASGFLAAILAGWLILGQTLGSFWLWLCRGLPALWHTSPLLRQPTAYFPPGAWLAVSGIGLIIALIFFRTHADRKEGIIASVFLAFAGLLAWKAVALQPFGSPEIFPVTLVVAAFLVLHAGGRMIIPVLLGALGFGGLIFSQPLILTDGVGHFNRQLLNSVRATAALPEMRETLRVEMRQLIGVNSLPRIKAVVGDATVDVIGEQPSAVTLGNMHLRFRPAPLFSLVRSSAIAELNAQAMSGTEAPQFVLFRLQAIGELVPTLADAAAQLELFQDYEFILEEDGLMLWKRKNSAREKITPTLVKQGELAVGEALPMPPVTKGTGYWLELDLKPSFLGNIWSILGETGDPGLLVRDNGGHELYYSVLPSVASRGFLVSPFVRGEPDFLKLENGTAPPEISTVTPLPPAHGSFLWSKHVGYRLYAVPDLKLTENHKLGSEIFDRYRLFNRTPTALSYLYPIKVLPYEPGVSIAFAHPSSSIEFAINAHDRHVHAAFGMLNGSYQNKNTTDGVDFSVEFIPPDGLKQILYHRRLDPLSVAGDRGRQQLDVAWPSGEAGRLILRTYNPPGRSIAFDWSYWGDITIE